MGTYTTERKCPFCGERFTLGACPIVSATGVSTTPGAANPFGGASEPNSPTDVQVLSPPPSENVGWVSKAFGSLPRPDAQWDVSLIPRRQCPSCDAALPLEIDDSEVFELAVVGLNRAGKTYWIGSAFTRATRTDSLSEFGIDQMSPLDDTATTLYSRYYIPLFKDSFELPFTNVQHHLHEAPLLFEVKLNGHAPFILSVKDVSGEVLVQRQGRLQSASFVAKADGIVFVVDPRDMYQIEDELPAELDVGPRNLDQVALLEAVLRESVDRGRPMAIAVSKGDLIEDLMPGTPLGHLSRGDWRQAIREHSSAVRTLLLELGERKLVGLADSQSSTYHIMSVLGMADVRAARRGKPAPLGTLEPLATIITRMWTRAHAS